MAIARKDARLKMYAAEEELSDSKNKLVELQGKFKFQKSKHAAKAKSGRQVSSCDLIKFSSYRFGFFYGSPLSFPSCIHLLL